MKVNDEKNPLGTDGFEFVEYSAPDDAGIKQIKSLFSQMGFTAIARHKRKNVTLFRQAKINFLVNAEPGSYFKSFSERHGPCACAMAFRVRNAEKAFNYAVLNGATPFDKAEISDSETRIPAIYGIGKSVLYFVDQYNDPGIYTTDFDFFDGVIPDSTEAGLTTLDHLTHNVRRGHMDEWSNFYERIGNFREIRYFDIHGKMTGLVSRAMTSPCGKIRIPINESTDKESQIEEYLRQYHGEGIQHIALSTPDIYATVKKLRSNGVEFMSTPDTYYENIGQRIPDHGENLEQLKELRILIDGKPAQDEGVLLQIFTKTVIGPIFFEIIQRKGNQGFGEGNFKALFESIEEDQIRRGVIKTR